MVMISNYYDATNLVRESESESCGDGEYIVSSDSDSGSDRNPLGLYTRADDEVCVSQYISSVLFCFLLGDSVIIGTEWK